MNSNPLPVRLFVSDIDGCLGEPYEAFHLPSMQRLVDLVARGLAKGESSIYPPFTLCSGRPFPYVEALTQIMGIRVPVLFESGGGLFDPTTARMHWHPSFDDDLREEIEALGRWMIESCMPGTSLLFEYAKRTQAGMISPFSEEIDRWVPVVEAYVEAHHPRLTVFRTHASIDVQPEGISKYKGLNWLSEMLDIPLEAMAYIGDASGDIEALRAVGTSFAPDNAVEAVRSIVHRVTASRIGGVVEAYEACVALNSAGLAEHKEPGA